jgi:uncharacterized protein DUF1488
MPLKRSSLPFEARHDGIYFRMSHETNQVCCLLTREALAHRGCDCTQNGEVCFEKYREEIEQVASRKHDAGHISGDGIVIVTTRDLNPELFSKAVIR